MPNSMLNDDALMRSTGRLAVVRALLASRTWPRLTELTPEERDLALDGMARRDARSPGVADTAAMPGSR